MPQGLAHLEAIGVPLVHTPCACVTKASPSWPQGNQSKEKETNVAPAASAVASTTDTSETHPASVVPVSEAADATAGCYVPPADVQQVIALMQDRAAALGLSSARFLAVEAGYYEQTLEWRRDRLGAGNVEELCKSIVMENTKISPDDDPKRIRCVLFIVQYVAKLANKEGLIRVMQAAEAALGLPALGKKQYNMRLLEGNACAEVTGAEHNAVTPLGVNLTVIVSDRIEALPSGTIWLGGGHVDLKLQVKVAELKQVLGASVMNITA